MHSTIYLRLNTINEHIAGNSNCKENFSLVVPMFNRNEVPESDAFPVARNTGPERRSTGVRHLESSKVRDAPACRRTLATAR